MELNRFQSALFNLDGVVMKTTARHANAWKRVFDDFFQKRQAQTGQSCEPFHVPEDYRQFLEGRSYPAGANDYLRSRGLELPWGAPDDSPDSETICGLASRAAKLFQQDVTAAGIEVWDDAIELLEEWKRAGWKVGVFSINKQCDAILQAADQPNTLDVLVDGNDLDEMDEAANAIQRLLMLALDRLDVDPAETVLLDASAAGVKAGRVGEFGLVVGVDRSGEAERLKDAEADIVEQDLRELSAAANPPAGQAVRQTPAHALNHFEWIANRINDRALGLFLDYDGTLTSIASRPEQATLSDEMRSLLKMLSERYCVVIISGRDRANVEEMVDVPDLIYAGCHGFDVQGPDISLEHEQAKRTIKELDKAEHQLRQQLNTGNGIRVERKRFSVAVHYREAESGDAQQRIEQAIDQLCSDMPQLRKTSGKMVFEVQPNVDWDKGKAVIWLAEELDFAGSGTIVIYIGDDETDEDAFRALCYRVTGIGIRVGLPASGTSASYFLHDEADVIRFLQSLLDLPQPEQSHNRNPRRMRK